jgi:glycerophosphoryl diester phosphodiesterase
MRKFIAATVLPALAISFLGVPAYAAETDLPTIVAHAGGKGMAPENTVMGMQVAHDNGATVIEVDVRWSANANLQTNPGWPVLMHDPTLDRTTNGSGEVAKSGYPAMTKMLAQDYAPFKTDPAYANVKVPYAYDFLYQASKTNSTLLMDVKIVPGQWNAWNLMNYVDRFPNGRERMIYMGNEASVKAMRSWYPDLKYAVIEWPAADTMRTAEYLKNLGVQAYAVPAYRITDSMVDYYHANGLKVYTWTTDSATYDTKANWDKVTAAGVDFLITDKTPQALANQK